jgi:hypothetical protein
MKGNSRRLKIVSQTPTSGYERILHDIAGIDATRPDSSDSEPVGSKIRDVDQADAPQHRGHLASLL